MKAEQRRPIWAIAGLAAVLLTTVNVSYADEIKEDLGAGPFYVWEGDVPATAGQLLRQQPLEKELVLSEADSGTRILYASQGWNGQPVAVSGTVFIPKGEAPETGWPVLAWSHGTVGTADICAPSYAGQSPRDQDYLNKWLKAGYAIVATDYEGLGTPGAHTYLHCQSQATANVDAVRSSQQLGQNLSKRWLVVGQSQGGQAALCTGGIAATHAPELDFLGVLATAPAVYFARRFGEGDAEDPNPFIGFSLMLARGFEAFEPTFRSENAFRPEALALLPLTDTACVDGVLGAGMKAGLTTGQSLKVIPFGDIPGVAQAAEKMKVPIGSQSAPVYIGQGTSDPIVHARDVYEFSTRLCDTGVAVTLDIYDGADHSGPMNTGFDAFVAWVTDRFAGNAVTNNCEAIETLAP
ncbi:MAG: lipase family protein [Alphaproteobacteria bacterium]